MMEMLQINQAYQSIAPHNQSYIYGLWKALEHKDIGTQGHMFRVAYYAKRLAALWGLDQETQDCIVLAGLLHDIGKYWVTTQVLLKPASLTQEEFSMVQQHPTIGKVILATLDFPENIITAVEYHHKRFDLQGYPYKAEIDELPLEAAIIGISDAFDAMTTSRPYRKPLPLEEAKQEIEKNIGTQFHPELAEAFITLLSHKR